MRSLPADCAPTVALDFETTGLSAAQHRVLEVALVRVDPQAGTRRELSMLIDPCAPISEQSFAVHGIRPEQVAGAPTFAQALPRLIPLLQGAVLIAHSAPFDVGFLHAECARIGAISPDAGVVIDTLSLARGLFRLPRCSLSALAQRVGLPFHGAHRALPDARATMAIYQQMIRHAQPGRMPTVGDMLSLAQNGADQREIRAALQAAIQAGAPIEIDYTSSHSGALTTRRTISVLRLHHRRVVAWCHLRNAERTFRVDRIRRASLGVAGLQPALGVDGRHAAAACRGDRLPVGVVLDITAGEDTGNAGL